MLESILFTGRDPSKASLNDMALYHRVHLGIDLTRQAIGQHFTPSGTEFLKMLLTQALKSNFSGISETFVDSVFNRILIKDSTCHQLPANLADKYPGSGGASSKASVRVQFEYDLKNLGVTELEPHAFNKQDITEAKEKLCNIQKDDLLIRDMGFVSMEVLAAIGERGAWYICRLNNNYDVYDKETGEGVDFGKLEGHMRRYNIQTIEKQVLLGSKRLPTRLVVELVPESVRAGRIRKAKRKSTRTGSATSGKSRARLGLNLFLANCPATMVSASEIRKIYGIRWQVELVFKAWKQNAEFHKSKKMNVHRYEFLLYAKLLMILLGWRFYQFVDRQVFVKHRIRISVLKFYKAMNQFDGIVKGLIRGVKESMEKLITWLMEIGKKFLAHEDRKNRINWRHVQNI